VIVLALGVAPVSIAGLLICVFIGGNHRCMHFDHVLEIASIAVGALAGGDEVSTDVEFGLGALVGGGAGGASAGASSSSASAATTAE
jgi:hypothetical protein